LAVISNEAGRGWGCAGEGSPRSDFSETAKQANRSALIPPLPSLALGRSE
jgi:hypothetical protein